MYTHRFSIPRMLKDARSLIFAQQRIRNMRKDHTTEDIIMFERNAGLLIKLKDLTAALDNCVLNEVSRPSPGHRPQQEGTHIRAPLNPGPGSPWRRGPALGCQVPSGIYGNREPRTPQPHAGKPATPALPTRRGVHTQP